MTKEDVKRLLMTIEAIYPNFRVRDLQVTLDAWFEILEDQDSKAIFASLKQYSRTSRSDFAPGAGQLIQVAYDLSSQRDTLSPGEAWSMVYKAICRGNYHAEEDFNKFPEEIKKAVGSHMQLKAWASDPSFNEGVASSNFRRAYENVCERKKQDALMPPSMKNYLKSLDIKCLESGDLENG